MNKKSFFVFTVIMAVIIAGCASSPERAGTSQTGSSDHSAFFNGFWELPNGWLIYIYYNAFVLYDNDSSVLDAGIIRIYDTRLILNIDADSYAVFDYKRVSDDMNVTGDEGNEFANGIWTKNAGMSFPDSGINSIEGYWEYSDSNEVIIFHIVPDGYGFLYFCDIDFIIDFKRVVLYEGASPSALHVISYDEDGQPYESAVLNVTYNENNSIIVKIGDELAEFVKR